MISKFKELKNVSWVKPKDLAVNILMVLVFSSLMGALIYFLDLGVTSIMRGFF